MRCAWNEFLSILPIRLRREVDRLGKDRLNELRLRINAPPELVLGSESRWLCGDVTRDEMDFVINTASRYSPWTAASVAEGYITAPGGHRIGICGEFLCKNGSIEGIRQIRSLCIRVARDFPGIGSRAADLSGAILILGAPGWGKTTLLRDMIRFVSEKETVCVVDERKELFPDGSFMGKKMDVITGCPKAVGIEMALRTMGPECIAVDEITARQDCLAMINASNCGIRLIATAHASSIHDFQKRRVYHLLIENHVFDMLILMHKDKSYETERITR